MGTLFEGGRTPTESAAETCGDIAETTVLADDEEEEE
jgi:hypothetical protein